MQLIKRRSIIKLAIIAPLAYTIKARPARAQVKYKHNRSNNRRMRKALRKQDYDRYIDLYTDQAFRYADYCKA